MAMVLSIARDVKEAGTSTTAKLREWRFHALSVTYQVIVLASEDALYWYAANCREDMVSMTSACQRTPVFQAFFVVLDIGCWIEVVRVVPGRLETFRVLVVHTSLRSYSLCLLPAHHRNQLCPLAIIFWHSAVTSQCISGVKHFARGLLVISAVFKFAGRPSSASWR